MLRVCCARDFRPHDRFRPRLRFSPAIESVLDSDSHLETSNALGEKRLGGLELVVRPHKGNVVASVEFGIRAQEELHLAIAA